MSIWLGSRGGASSIELRNGAELVRLLRLPATGNAIQTLYAQLLSVKLDPAAAERSPALAATIEAADRFLAGHDPASWPDLAAAERQQLLAWATTLNQFTDRWGEA